MIGDYVRWQGLPSRILDVDTIGNAHIIVLRTRQRACVGLGDLAPLFHRGVVQQVERQALTLAVGGSNPSSPTKLRLVVQAEDP